MSLKYQGKTALVTGASAGIGVEFANQLAANGANLVLVARRTDRLQVLAQELGEKHGVTVSYIALDLGLPDSGSQLTTQLLETGVNIDILINNAGFATNNLVLNEDRSLVQSQIQLNVGTLVDLTVGLLPAMHAQDSGIIVNVASTAAFQPVPNLAVYAATKAFVLSFTEALWGELRGTNVKALALCPGATVSEFWEVANMGSKTTSGFQTAEQVVSTALRELGKRKSGPSVVSGRINKTLSTLVRFAPKKVAISTASKLFEPSSEH